MAMRVFVSRGIRRNFWPLLDLEIAEFGFAQSGGEKGKQDGVNTRRVNTEVSVEDHPCTRFL